LGGPAARRLGAAAPGVPKSREAPYLADETGRRDDAATPVTGVGVCQASSSVDVREPTALARGVPARDMLVAPSPTVAATQVIAIATARRMAPNTGLHVNDAASIQMAPNTMSPIIKART